MSADVVGYLVWVRTQKGAPSPVKHDKLMRDGRQPENVKAQHDATIKAVPLTADEWALSLNDLAEKYPCP